MDDREQIREYLRSWGTGSWSRPDDDEYVNEVQAELAALRADHPDGDYPASVHGQDDIGACAICDALHILYR